MTDACRRRRTKDVTLPGRHIRVGPDLSHAVRCVAPGCIHPLMERQAGEVGGSPQTQVHFFPLDSWVGP